MKKRTMGLIWLDGEVEDLPKKELSDHSSGMEPWRTPWTIKRRTIEKIGLALVLTAIVGMVLLLGGCGGGASYAGAGADAVPLKPAMREAISRINARGDGWLTGVDTIRAADRDPPRGVNYATVDCPGDVVLYRTTFDKSAEFFERLLVHEAHEINQHDCTDHDAHTSRFVQCYASGKSYVQCVREIG